MLYMCVSNSKKIKVTELHQRLYSNMTFDYGSDGLQVGDFYQLSIKMVFLTF
jgi:hypothetical protein